MKTSTSFLLLIALAPLFAAAAIDHEAARALAKEKHGTVKNASIAPIWAPDGSALYYRFGDGEILRVDTASGKKTVAFDSDQLSPFFGGRVPRVERFAISNANEFTCVASSGKKIHTLSVSASGAQLVPREEDPFALPPRPLTPGTRSRKGAGATKLFFINDTDRTVDVEWIDSSKERKKQATLQPGETRALNTHAGHVFAAGALAFQAIQQPAVAYLDATPEPPRKKPKARPWRAHFKEHDLFVKNTRTGVSHRLTNDGSSTNGYAAPLYWSPNDRHLVAMKVTTGTRREIALAEAAPDDRLQPKIKTIAYPKPGDELDVAKPHLFDLENGKEIPLDDALFSNPWSIRAFHWSPRGDRLFFLYNERGHQTLRLLAVEAATGKVATVIEERSATFIDYSNKTFIHHLDETDELIWMSERGGWNHLHLVNRRNGEIKPITTGEWVVRGVERVDPKKRWIWFTAGGVHPEQDPYHIHHARIDFDGSDLVVLTDGDGTHEVSFSADRGFFTDTWSRANQPPIHELRRSSDGEKIADLGKADATELLAVHPHLPEPVAAKGRDGETDIFGLIHRPSHFDPRKRYPVVESIYAGPHGQHVPKAFRPHHSQQTLAELGFIVVQIDGMGTNWRSKKFHDVCWKNLKDAGFPDRVAWMKAAAKRYPFMDLSRVGIYGGSAGGQNAMRAVLDHADFYQAAAADCGCHDNRMDKIWWNEAWMGWPVDESYEASSNVVDAHKLDGALFLTVGMMDSNVDPSSTLQVVEALIKADKKFDFLAFPSGGHGCGSSAYGARLRAEFFVRELSVESE